MLENLTLDQGFGLIIIACPIGLLVITIVNLKVKRYQTGGLWAVIRQKRNKSVFVKQKEEGKLFDYGIYMRIILGFNLFIYGILLLIGVLEI